MRRAIALAEQNVTSASGGPFGAVVAVGDDIVGEGTNRVTGTCDPTAHAEIVAIRAAAQKLGRFSLDGAELFTSCEPCPMCLAAAYWARVDRVWYAADRDDLGMRRRVARAGDPVGAFADDLLAHGDDRAEGTAARVRDVRSGERDRPPHEPLLARHES